MLFLKPVIFTGFALAILYVLCRFVKYIQYERLRKTLGCAPLPIYPSKDKMLGIDYVYAMMKALKMDRFLQFQKDTYAMFNFTAWTANFLGNNMIYSCDAENMKAISTSHRDCFAVEPIRVGNGAITPFTGRGVSSLDGPKWHSSRELVKPYFERAAFSNLGRLAVHVDRLISKIPRDGSSVDMQQLLQRWVSIAMTTVVL
jgi:cytochrome P450 monooxygenase